MPDYHLGSAISKWNKEILSYIMPRMKLDEIDLNILGVLQNEARISNSALAEKVGLSPSPCLRRWRALEKDGVIRNYVTHLDRKALGLDIVAFISVRLEQQAQSTIEHFETEIGKCEEVLECYLMTGSSDYLLRVVAKDLSTFERFLKRKLTQIRGVATVESSFALSKIKYTNALPLRET